jgi:uncharacterized protein (TIGR02246 family)
MRTQDPGAAIAAVAEALDRALVANDAEACAQHFTPDAVLGESGMGDVVGRTAIREFLAGANKLRQVTHHRLTREDLIMVTDGRAVELARFEETKLVPGRAPIDEWGRVVTFWRHEPDGAWRVERMIISDLPGPV